MASTATATYKKHPGTLSLSPAALEWTPQAANSPALSLPTSDLAALFASKPGGPRIMLKVQLRQPLPPSVADDSHNFTFTSPASALSDRDRFKQLLSDVIASNREREASGAAAGAHGRARSAGSPLPTPGPSSSSSSTLDASQQATFRLRKLVLQSNPSLLALHRDLVLTGQITESEFWERREDLVASVAAEQGLVKGKSGEMVDPKTVTGQNGEVTVKITPGLIRDIFEEFPVVLRAYNDNVPDPLDEAQFWTRYFQSKLFNRYRTTNRAAVDAIKDDPIFDRYLDEEDDDVEPKHMPDHQIYRLLDLAATEEDQHEITNLPRDFTMKPGGQRSSLPLMRRFNEHSERLLSQALGSAADRNRGFLDPGHAGDRNYYSSIELTDLSSPSSSTSRIALPLPSSSGAPTVAGEKEDGGLEGMWEAREGVRKVVEGIRDEWEGRLVEVERNRKMAGTGGLPRAHLITVSSLSTTTFEFLRHFWSAILPPKPTDLSSSSLSPPDRAARAEKFKGGWEERLEEEGEGEQEQEQEQEQEEEEQERRRLHRRRWLYVHEIT
ncbi:RNA polymerase II transcription factorb subunit 1 [Rhodotorula toruloides]|uniref:RNA polymerase II transcription factorb subunit 1 n=1 Tax=Rhodotorula toruloides TaxID=5286 RepID=A0A511KBZ0_RHOTO|nr:RNA polymerase II transcription factorb subunit 1 [Rhodotorula toruloides]